MSDDLRRELARIAGEMVIMDVEPGVRAASRRLVRRRNLALTAAAVALVVAGTGVALALRPTAQGVPLPPATAAPTQTGGPNPTAGPTVVPTDATAGPTAAPTTAPGTDPSLVGCADVPPPVRSTSAFPGRFYTQQRRDSDGCVLLYEYSSAGRRTVLAVPDPHLSVANSLTVSPDGTTAAWVCCTDSESDLTGSVVVAAVDGTGARRVVADIMADTRPEDWSADSKHLVISRPQPVLRLEVATGRTLPVTLPSRYPVTSPNGRYHAHLKDTRTIVVTGPTEADRRETRDYGDPVGSGTAIGISLQGVTDDGLYLVVNSRPTDPGRVVGGRVVLRVGSGKVVSLPRSGDGNEVQAAVPRPGGGFMALTAVPGAAKYTRLLVLAADLTVIQEVPVAVEGLILRYVPP